MKKILSISFAVVVCLTGCRDYDYGYPYHYSEYSYDNQSSSEIVINCYGTFRTGTKIPLTERYTITIPAGERRSFPYKYSFTYFDAPLIINSAATDNYTTISNGEKIVTQKKETGELYLLENYTLVSEKHMQDPTDAYLYHRVYEYVFTDEFFEDGKPVAEE